MKFKSDKDRAIWMYKTMYTIRVFETRCIALYRKALIRGYFHPYLGEEAIATGVCAALEDGDYISSTHRGHGHCIARGADIAKMAAELFGKETGYCKGRGGSMHIADMTAGNLGANGVVAAGIPLGVGAAMAGKIRKDGSCSVVFTSDGGVCNGVFSEALNLAAIWNAPMILVIENNQYAVSTPVEDVSRVKELYKRGEALGAPSFRVDGNDVMKMYHLAKDARKRCVNGEGPVLIEAITYRQGGHHCNDPGKYMPEDKVKYFQKHDPVTIGRAHLEKFMSSNEIDEIDAEVSEWMDKAIKFAEESPEPSIDEFIEDVVNY